MSETSHIFIGLVASLSTAAMSALGKLKNPLTDKIEKRLEEAKQTIDMLAMLEEKTRGNLSDEESKYMSEVLTQLRVNYVQEAASEEKKENVAPEDTPDEKEEPESDKEKS